MNLDDLMAPLAAPAWLVGATIGAAALLFLVGALRYRKRPPLAPIPDRPTTRRSRIVQIAGALVPIVGTFVCADGIMTFLYGRGLRGVELYAAFTFLELATVYVALVARETRQETKRVGILGVAVWIIAALSGTFAALGAGGFNSLGAFRFVVALVAVFLWELKLFAEIGSSSTARWVNVLDRLLVRWGVKDATGRDATVAERNRRRAKFVRLVHEAISADEKGDTKASDKAWEKATTESMCLYRDGIITSDEDRHSLFDEVQAIRRTREAFTVIESDAPNPWRRPVAAPVASEPDTPTPSDTLDAVRGMVDEVYARTVTLDDVRTVVAELIEQTRPAAPAPYTPFGPVAPPSVPTGRSPHSPDNPPPVEIAPAYDTTTKEGREAAVRAVLDDDARMPVRQIASTVGLPVSTVQDILTRIRRGDPARNAA